ncbi:MAG: DUF167 domain-containing protein [Solirubrobacteraceae bacterium]|jgi:uncharacterized protein (TIGR00251 family)
MDEARIEVRLQPRSSRDELLGFRDGVLAARVCAPPVDGEANRALCRLIAQRANVAPSRVEVIRGERGRLKLIRVSGLRPEELLAALDLTP